MVREWEELEREPNLFQDVAGYYPSQYNMAEGGPPVAARAVMTTSSLFRVLGARFDVPISDVLFGHAGDGDDAASRGGTATRTTSQPADARRAICSMVASTSCV